MCLMIHVSGQNFRTEVPNLCTAAYWPSGCLSVWSLRARAPMCRTPLVTRVTVDVHGPTCVSVVTDVCGPILTSVIAGVGGPSRENITAPLRAFAAPIIRECEHLRPYLCKRCRPTHASNRCLCVHILPFPQKPSLLSSLSPLRALNRERLKNPDLEGTSFIAPCNSPEQWWDSNM